MTLHNSGDRGFFELVAPLYDLAMPAAETDPLSGGLARAERPVDRVLDLGGGTGRASLAIRAASDHQEPVVVDATQGMLSVARERSLEAVTGDAGRLPVRSEGADGAVIVDALHHFPDTALALEETARVLRPGGVVVIREFDPGHPVGGLLAVGERAIGMDSLLMRPATLVGKLETAGFRTDILDRGFTYTIAATLPPQ